MTDKSKLEVWTIRHKETKEIWQARSAKRSCLGAINNILKEFK